MWNIRSNRIRNDRISNKVKITPREDKTRETRLIWFLHVKRSVDVPVRICELINLTECKKVESS